MTTIVVLLTLAAAQAADRPVPTKEAAGKMTVPDGFKVTLFAGEPDVVQPIAFTFDDRGRMWVVECLSYPNWSKTGKGSDRVIILEDTDGDGVHDKKTVFMADGVNLSGIELGFGGVWLCSSPNLVFVPILEGDKPGKPEVVLDGWNMIDTKHNIFNSLGWGPDGWLYGCNGIQAKAWVGKPGTPKENRTYLDCGVWRYHPTRKVFEAVAHGTTNPFGLDWDEYGEMFITNCVIDHLFHFVPGGHYERMYGEDANPHVYGLMKSCVDYKHWAGGDWTSSRSMGVGGDPKHSDFGGGHAHSGCAIYLGDNFPAEYRNTVFTANIHGNRLNNDGLKRTPAGYAGVRRPDFLFANDSWFRGICVKTGPEGGLYVSDWCDTGECHNYDKCDITNGRIYRVVYKTPKVWTGDVSKLTDAELVKLQLSPNDWFVRHARRVLQERAAAGKLEKETAEGLRKILAGGNVPRQLRALWCLEVIGQQDAKELTHLLDNANEPIRGWAYRLLAADMARLTEESLKGMWNLARHETSQYVRLQIASALQHFPPELKPRGDLATAAIANPRPVEDHNLAFMLWYALEGVYSQRPDFATGNLGWAPTPLIRQNTVRLLLAQPEPMRGKLLEKLMKELGAGGDWDAKSLDILRAMRESFAGRKDISAPNTWATTFAELRTSNSKDVVREAEAVAVLFGDRDAISSLSNRITDAKAAADDRRAAIELLLSRKQPEFGKTLRGLLDDPAVRQVAVRGLAAFADAETPAAILKAYPQFTPEEKLDAVNTLAARVPWANALLDAIEKKTLPRADVPVTTARQILALNDKALSTRLDTVWGKVGNASKERAALMKKWKEQLTEPVLAKATPANGRTVFAKHCAACHKMFGDGGTTAPELTGSQRANLDYVLENVLDPSAVVPREFKLVIFTTKDERVVAAIILRETKDAVTIDTGRDTLILPTADIAARKPTNLSIMPDGLFDQMRPEEVADLVAYLRSKEQVPLPK